MPAQLPHPSVPRAGITRRQGLTALALLAPVGLLTACSSGAAPDESSAVPSPATVTSVVAAAERELVALYDAVIAAHPELAGALKPIGDQHREHASVLGGTDNQPASAEPTVPTTSAQEAVDVLISAERQAMRQRVDACVEAGEPDLARTLAFIAASEGSHVPALRDVRT